MYGDRSEEFVGGCEGLKVSSLSTGNFNFQWTKTLYHNNLKNIAFFFTFFKGSRCN